MENDKKIESLDDFNEVETLDNKKNTIKEPKEEIIEENINEEKQESKVEEIKEEPKKSFFKLKKSNSKYGFVFIIVLLIIAFVLAFLTYGKDLFKSEKPKETVEVKKEEKSYIDVSGQIVEDNYDDSIDEDEQQKLTDEAAKNRLLMIMNLFSKNKSNTMFRMISGVNKLTMTEKLDLVINSSNMAKVEKKDLNDNIKSKLDEKLLESGKIVKINFDQFDQIFNLLLGDNGSFDESLIREACSCPSLVFFDLELKEMYFSTDCQKIELSDYKIDNIEYKEGIQYYYIYTDVNKDGSSYKLMWKFDKKYKFLKTMIVK